MQCPHCCIKIHLPIEKTEVWKIENNEEELLGHRISYGHCPACNKLIVIREQGQIKNIPHTNSNSFDRDLKNIQQEVLYPKKIYRKVATEIPENYRKDVLEAWSILDLSPKGSAVLSRRILEEVLENEFNIQDKNLGKKIEKFLNNKDVPSIVREMIDAIRHIGNFGAHPKENIYTSKIINVSEEEAELLINLLDELFDFVFVQPKIMSLKRQRLNEKLKASGKDPEKVYKSNK